MDLLKFQKIEERLRGCSSKILDYDSQNRMKKNILSAIKSDQPDGALGFSALIERIKIIAAAVRPRQYFSMLLRERLVTLAEYSRARWSIFSSPFFRGRYTRKIMAGGVAFVFLFTLLFNFTFKIERAEASFLTLLEESSGNVTIVRDSAEIPGVVGFLLKADDIIRTGKNSRATIRFLDQSIGRLDENSEISISQLTVNPLNKTETTVEVVLHTGRLWARVINLIDNLSYFQVKVKNALAVAKKKAAFDVSVSPKGHATVVSVKNRVDLVVASPQKVVETTLVNGFSAEIKSNTSSLPKITTTEKAPADNSPWIADNLAQDKVYIEQVKQEAQDQIEDQVNILPSNPFYAVKELSEGTKIALTFDDFERHKKILLTAQEKLAEAEVLLGKRDIDGANALLKEFQAQIQAVFAWVKDHEVASPIETLEIKSTIIEILDSYQKQLTLILPGDPVYRLKEVVAQTQVLVASSQLKKTQEQISQASDKLIEAHDLVEQGETVKATEQVAAYSEAISKVSLDVKQMPAAVKEKAVTALLDNKVEDLKVLESISATPTATLTTSGAQSNDDSAKLPATTGTSTFLVVPGTSSLLTATSTTAVSLLGSSTLQAAKATAEAAAAVTAALEKVQASETSELHKTVRDAKAEALTKIGEAVLDAQNEQPSAPVLEKIQEIKNIGVNGQKPLVDVRLGSPTKLPTTNSGTQISPRAQP